MNLLDHSHTAAPSDGLFSKLEHFDDAGSAENVLIGQMAQLLNLQPQTIRFYERLGLVNPKRLGRLRVYDKEDFKTLRFVKYMRELGVSLQSIKTLVGSSVEGQKPSLDAVEVQDFLCRHLVRMKVAQSNLENQINELSARLGHAPQ